ncbi:hypothetical protein PR048_010281 [Dryococelus australis]|uniref:KIF-binding protein n=1 Tax=Dryococelus australis TaxID=614101 RepID=A0ABQ9I2E7_9NEOP|nr:hypothetical protein PR048_010281 [Dryococelus australis]
MHFGSKDTLIELQENYSKVRKLLDQDSKNDPVSEPYRSKYTASAILTEMKSKLCKILDEGITDDKQRRYKAMLGSVWLHLGTISVDTEEFSTGEEQLLNCVSILSKDALKRESILVLLTALNQLGILWSQRDQPAKSKEYLEMAEKYYKEFVENNPTGCITMYNLFHLDDFEAELPDTEHSLEKTHTLTLYYLAQIYSSLNDHLKAAVYCHTTLKRQLEYKDFDPVDWALNSATLSQYFMEECGFKQARHHLAAASFILDQYKEMESTEGSNADSLEAK